VIYILLIIFNFFRALLDLGIAALYLSVASKTNCEAFVGNL